VLVSLDGVGWFRWGRRGEGTGRWEAVIASDGEGIECRVIVSEISGDGRYAILKTEGRLRRSEGLRPSVSDLFAGRGPLEGSSNPQGQGPFLASVGIPSEYIPQHWGITESCSWTS
jgi:hypothetical protein